MMLQGMSSLTNQQPEYNIDHVHPMIISKFHLQFSTTVLYVTIRLTARLDATQANKGSLSEGSQKGMDAEWDREEPPVDYLLSPAFNSLD